MKNNIKRLSALALVGGLCMTQLPIHAQVLQDKVNVSVKKEVIRDEMKVPAGTLVLEESDYVVKGEERLIPLRKVMEFFGFEVGYNKEEQKATVNFVATELGVSLSGEYTVNGNAVEGEYNNAIVQDGSLFVDSKVIADTFPVQTAYAGTELYLRKVSIAKPYSGFGEVTEILEGSKDTLLVTFNNNFDMQQYRLVVGKDTVITDGVKGTDKKAKDISVGDFIYSEYNAAMTRSIPPQTLANKIEIVKDQAITYGIVEKVDGDTIYIHDGTIGDIHVKLMDDAVLVTEDGKTLSLEDFKPGDKIRTYHSQGILAVMPTTLPTVKVVKL